MDSRQINLILFKTKFSSLNEKETNNSLRLKNAQELATSKMTNIIRKKLILK